MARFSIVVPLWAPPSRFDETLASVLRNRPANSQIIVPYFGHYDDPYDLAKEVDFLPVNASGDKPTELAGLINAGLSTARGPWIAVIRPGIQLSEDWEIHVENVFSDSSVGSIVPILVDSQDSDRVIAAGVESTKRYNRRLVACNQRIQRVRTEDLNPLAPTSWAGFYRKSLLTSLGGFDETLQNLYCDLDLGMSLQFLDFKTVICADCVLTVDRPEEILQESEMPHGVSAQRALVRFTDLDSNQRRSLRKKFFGWDVLTSGFKWQQLSHAWQRQRAEDYLTIDQNHRELLNLLQKQRDRLSSPALHLKVATVRERSQIISKRRAA